ncbi:MAG: glycosyltransferase family 2 protein [Deltaproteobacteria bacterium]|nr:glycosyltransferase family 2 protein [Deltaproteobacteria bacterium]
MGLLFSVVIPTYRRRDALRNSLQSLSCQTIDKNSFEVVVVNNSPEIGVADIIEAYASLINIISLNEPKPGAHSARNVGSKVARGRYIVFIDDDCEAHPSLLERYCAAVELFSPIVAGGSIEIKWDYAPPSWVTPFECLMGRTNFGEGSFWLREGLSVYGGNLLIRRDFFLEIGGMEPDQVGKIILGSGDVALSLSANRRGHKVLWVGDARVWHHQRRGVNARLRDLMRREFNNGIMTAFELQKKDNRLSTLGLGPLSLRLFITAINQFFRGSLRLNKHALANACLALSKLIGLHWFYFYKSRTAVCCIF